MQDQILERLGLSKGEVKVYSALMRLGEATITPLTNESSVTKSKIYDILEKLIKKGLVGYNIKKGVKHFFMNDPRKIIEFLNKKEEEIEISKKEIESILPSLLEQRKFSSLGRIAEIYEGFNGMKTIREELMLSCKKGETMLVLGAPKIANDKWEGWLLEFHKKRVKKNIGMKIIYNSDAREYGKVRTEMKFTEVKYFQEGINSPNWIDIFPEAVMISIISGETVISFVIKNKEISNSFRTYFEIMWKIAKK